MKRLVPLEDVRSEEVVKLLAAGHAREIVGEFRSKGTKFRADGLELRPQRLPADVVLGLVPLLEHHGPDILVIEVVVIELADDLEVPGQHLRVQVRSRHFAKICHVAPCGNENRVLDEGAVPHRDAFPTKEVENAVLEFVPRRGVIQLAIVGVDVVVEAPAAIFPTE